MPQYEYDGDILISTSSAIHISACIPKSSGTREKAKKKKRSAGICLPTVWANTTPAPPVRTSRAVLGGTHTSTDHMYRGEMEVRTDLHAIAYEGSGFDRMNGLQWMVLLRTTAAANLLTASARSGFLPPRTKQKATMEQFHQLVGYHHPSFGDPSNRLSPRLPVLLPR